MKIRWVFALLAIILSINTIAQEVIPDFYQDPGLYPNRNYINQNFNEYIDPFTGALQRHYVDLHIPGNGGFDLDVTRSYNSSSVDSVGPASYNSLAGVGWTIHFGRVLKIKEKTICTNKNALSVVDNPVLELADGSRQLLVFTGGNAPLMLTTQRWRADCLNNGAGLAVYSPEGVRYDMTHLVNTGTSVNPVYSWFTTKITDQNGNYATISYAANSSPEITRISTNDGRTVSFNYANSGQVSRRITSISAAGQTYQYAYQAISGIVNKYFLTAVTRPDGSSWRYSYNGNLNNSPGSYLIKATTHPQGGTVNYGYGFVYFDTQANPASRSTVITAKTLSTGGSWIFSYTPGGYNAYDTTTVKAPNGTITYKHIGPNYTKSGTVWMAGLLVSKSIGSIQTEAYTWGSQKISNENYFRPGAFVLKVDTGATNAPVLTKKVITRNGASYTTNFSNFDNYGNPAVISETGTSGGSRTTNATYYINASKWIIQQIKDETFTGGSIKRSFNSQGNLISISQDGVTTSYQYDNVGNVSSVTFPRSLTHHYSNYKRGIPQSESQPEGVSISRSVSDAGNVTSESNGEGYTTSYSYDKLNRVTSISHPRGSNTSISYSNTSKTVSRGSLVEVTRYNGVGQPTSISLDGISRTFKVDALGQRTFESNPGSSVGTSYQYDLLGRVTRITHADNTSQSTSYGAGKKTVTDERGKSTTFTYRAYGNPDQHFLMAVAAPDSSASLSISRNNRDLITSIKQAGLTRNYGYNSNYYLTSITAPETGKTTFARDAAGNMTSRSVGSSGTTNYSYDSQNRLVTINYPGATPSIKNTYSRTHRLRTADSATGKRSFTYDGNDNLISESVLVDGLSFTASYSYNSLDQLSTIKYPRSGTTINYSPDTLGRPTQVSGYIDSVSYWSSGQIKQIKYANGTVSNYGQNSRLWPSSFSTSKGSTNYTNSSYSYDGAGNLTSISDSSDSSYNRTMSYDNINRLTSIQGSWGAGSIAYNGAGNITSQKFGSASLSYSYDGSNRLSNTSGTRVATYNYDAYGNVSSSMGNTYLYDGVPNLRCINCSNSANKIEYSYDGLNQRSSVDKKGVKSYEMHSSLGHQLIEFTPAQANKLVEYVYLGDKRVAQKVTAEVVPDLAETGKSILIRQICTCREYISISQATANTPCYVCAVSSPPALTPSIK